MSFVHLQLTSSYDLLSSTITLSALLDKVQNEKMEAVALTDRNTLHGAIPFYKQAKARGIRPIIGLTADYEDENTQTSHPVILLAENNAGYHHLLKISSAIQTKTPEGIPLKWLRSYAKGLIAIIPGSNDEFSSLTEEQWKERVSFFAGMFGSDCFYIGVESDSPDKEARLESAAKAGAPVVALQDVRYLEQEHYPSYEVLTAIRDGETVEEVKTSSDQHAFLAAQVMVDRFYSNPDALENTLRIAARCNVELSFNEMHLPRYPLPDDVTSTEMLRHLCHQGLKKRVASPSESYFNRLDYELNVIEQMSFNDYFLIVWDFMKFAREKKILTGPGRGSAAGSLVAYTLYITHVDPIEHDLLFERFLNPERVSMPDIDIDFPDHRRDEVIQYVAGKYGQLHVAQIITFGTLSAKAVARDTARAFGFSSGELEVISRAIPTKLGITLQEALDASPKLRTFRDQSARYRLWFDIALQLEGLPRHSSTHAAGVVMSDRPLVEMVPLQEGHQDILLTQWPMDILESIGLLKMDFLGLRNLTILERIVSSVRQDEKRSFTIETIPMDDEKTFTLLGKGLTTGIFQLESEGMRNVLQTLRPSEFEDIVAVNALYRPGPMENIPSFVRRKHGQENVEYKPESLRPVLEKTYGIIVYQEQIMQIASEMAGFSLGEADLLRRAVSKKKKEDLDRERGHFVTGALAKGYQREEAERVYDLIVRFADYGFNRSHAVAYSLIGYQLAYLKAHYPAHFMAALMTSVTGNDDKISQYVRECDRLGITVLPPSIQKSQRYFAVEDGKIRYSISAIKGIGAATARDLIEARGEKGFEHLFDVCMKVPKRSSGRKILESLVFSGAMDDFGHDRATILATLDAAIEHAQLMSPGGLLDEDFGIRPKYVKTSPMPVDMKLQYEKESLGLYLSAHPVSQMKETLQSLGAQELADLKAGQKQAVAGALINDVRAIRTKKGDAMAFVELSDASGEMSAVAFPELYRSASKWLQQGLVVVVSGKVEERNGKNQLVLQKIGPAEQFERPVQRVYVKIPARHSYSETLKAVREFCYQHRGDLPVVVHDEETKKTIQLQQTEWVQWSVSVEQGLKQLVGEQNVIIR